MSIVSSPGNLLDVTLKVAEFMREVCNFTKRQHYESSEDNYLSENSGRVESPYSPMREMEYEKNMILNEIEHLRKEA
jgi:hypothetical protein